MNAYSCYHDNKWYREGETITEGVDRCRECVCVDSQMNCNDDNCSNLSIPDLDIPGERTNAFSGGGGDNRCMLAFLLRYGYF